MKIFIELTYLCTIVQKFIHSRILTSNNIHTHLQIDPSHPRPDSESHNHKRKTPQTPKRSEHNKLSQPKNHFEDVSACEPHGILNSNAHIIGAVTRQRNPKSKTQSGEEEEETPRRDLEASFPPQLRVEDRPRKIMLVQPPLGYGRATPTLSLRLAITAFDGRLARSSTRHTCRCDLTGAEGSGRRGMFGR